MLELQSELHFISVKNTLAKTCCNKFNFNSLRNGMMLNNKKGNIICFSMSKYNSEKCFRAAINDKGFQKI